MDEQLKTVTHLQQTALDMAMQFGPRLLVALLILGAGYYAGLWIGRMAERGLHRFHLDAPVAQLMVRVVRLTVLALFGIMALQNLGVQLLPLIAGLGVAGAGVALAMQGVLGNVVAGLTILFTRPFRVGDYISIVGKDGRVEDITLFTTVLSHTDLSRVVIPNRKIVGEILHNHGRILQLDLRVLVAHDADLAQALELIGRTLAAEPLVLADPAPFHGIDAITPAGIQIAIRPWVLGPDLLAGQAAVGRAVAEALRRGGIALPPTSAFSLPAPPGA